jgi:MFS family permease
MSHRVIETDIPARLDRLRWSGFHTLVVVALGITWVLDGLEVTLAGSVSAALRSSPVLRMSDAQVGASASAYLAGAVLGAMFFGWLTDLLGRKRLFFITLGVYVAATGLTAFAQDFVSFAIFRFLTGCGIGGEYVAINSAIQELIPARFRGRTDLAINGSFWLGAMAGSGGTVFLLDPERFDPELGWRLAFGIGAALGLLIVFFRRSLPESPRWLLIHGRVDEADRVIEDIERRAGQMLFGSPLNANRTNPRRTRSPAAEASDLHHARAQPGGRSKGRSANSPGSTRDLPHARARHERPRHSARDRGGSREAHHHKSAGHASGEEGEGSTAIALPRLRLRVRTRAVNLVDLAVSLFRLYPDRAVLGLVLMAAQAFFYNAIFFTYALVLARFFGVPDDRVGLYIVPFAVTNFIGPLAIGWLFDHWGRRRMIAGTYTLSGALLAITAVVFLNGAFTAVSLTIAFAVVFFFASAAASSAYLTVSETFPLEVRALAIAVFYAFGTGLGGVAAPWVFGTLIGTGEPSSVAAGYGFGALLMLVAGATAWRLGVPAERRSLEDVARPLSHVD